MITQKITAPIFSTCSTDDLSASAERKALAFDLGASSARAYLGYSTNNRITYTELSRLENLPLEINGELFWDINKLFDWIKAVIKSAAESNDISSVGIDTWGVDYGLIDNEGKLISLPHCYRDKRTNNAACVKSAYSKTGIQFLRFNTLYQLQREKLEAVNKILLLPDLLAFMLTKSVRTEITNASTTNLLSKNGAFFDEELLAVCGAKKEQFGEFIFPGESYGELIPEICGKAIPVIAVASHDTASAIAAIIHGNEPFAYISSGTWSLFGTESAEYIVTEESEQKNFSNELGINGIRFLKNVMGLFIIQRLKAEWNIDYSEMSRIAKNTRRTPKQRLINVDDDAFFAPESMTDALTEKSGFTEKSELLRCVYDSLAEKYRLTLKDLESITHKKYKYIHIIGGGLRDELLCKLTANACEIPVKTGPVEATVLGNLLVQLYKNKAKHNMVLSNTVKIMQYFPEN